MRTRVLLALAIAGMTFTACGGGSQSTPLPAATTSPAKQTSGNTTFVVKIPPKVTSAARSVEYLTADVQGIQFSVTQNSGAQNVGSVFYPISAQQSYCTTPSGGGLTCTLAVQAAAGDDTFVVTTYDKPELWDANVISTGSVEKTIASQTANTISIVTSGIPTFFAASLDNAFTGAAGTLPVHLLVLDADANVIVGPYDMPVTLSDSDTTGAATLSATSAASSTDAQALTLSYTGAQIGPATIGVKSNSPYAQSWNGTRGANLHFAPGTVGVVASPSYLLFANATAAPQTVTLSGAGATTAPYTANTNLDAYNDWGILDNLNEAWQWASGCQGIVTVSGTSPTFTVTPVHTGVCYLRVGDSAAHTGDVPVVVQSL